MNYRLLKIYQFNNFIEIFRASIATFTFQLYFIKFCRNGSDASTICRLSEKCLDAGMELAELAPDGASGTVSPKNF